MQWSNEHSTELRSAIGTLNIKSGKDKVARKHIEASMVGGNANAFAQASWLTYHEKLVLGQPETLQSGARSAEGLMYASRSSGNYTDALKHCGEWMKVEPFSLRPYREATHMALVALGDGAAAEDLCRKGLELRPNDAMLKNNRAVAEIYCGKIGDAEKRLRDIVSLDRHECAVIEATKGMVAFRSNDVTEGNRRYQKAEQFFKENGLATELSTALAFHGQELYRVNDVELAERLFSAAIECSRGHSNKELELLIERARRPIK
ncbi:MAG: hypothetical protein DHS20C11_13270 [Lysobacteraceae bacterium]|nr:MAG: hypothetical protein DHS20C11_13270 [Xanthomonadaceae bacterium]